MSDMFISNLTLPSKIKSEEISFQSLWWRHKFYPRRSSRSSKHPP